MINLNNQPASSNSASPSTAQISQSEGEHRIWLSAGTMLAPFIFIGFIMTVALLGNVDNAGIRLEKPTPFPAKAPGEDAAQYDKRLSLYEKQVDLYDQSLNEQSETLRWLTTATFPMFSGWIGTVLAFYFTSGSRAEKEGYRQLLENANEKIVAGGTGTGSGGADEKLKALRLSSQIHGLTFFENNLDAELVAVEQKIKDAAPRQRLLVLDDSGRFKTIVDLANIANFLAPPSGESPAGSASIDTSSIKLGEYIQNRPETSEPVVIFAAESDSLFDARTKMLNHQPPCTNLIVTQDGTNEMPVLAYLTDKDIQNLRG